MAAFHLEIVSPEGKLFDGEAHMLSVRGIEGDLAILAGHVPFVTALAPGEVRVYETADAEPRCGKCSGGCLTVAPGRTRLLAADFTWDGGSDR